VAQAVATVADAEDAGVHAPLEAEPTFSPSAPFITRPVATSLLMLAALLAGLLGYRMLPLSALPEVDYPTIQVTTYYPGASPDVMGNTVTAPLEVQFGQMSNLQRMTSTSSSGASVITLQFNLSLPIDIAEQEVQAAINAAGNLLPTDLPAPPVYAKVNPADAPVMTLALTSSTMPLTDLQALADQRLARRISQVDGVGQVSLGGGQRGAMRIKANPQALAAAGLSLDTLRSAISAANANGAKGSIDGPTRNYTIDANDQLLTTQQYALLVVAWRNGAAIRLSDVADIGTGAENSSLGASVAGSPAIILNVQRQPGANVVATVDRIRARLPELTASLPPDVKVRILSDRTNSIRASVRDVQVELLFAVALVVAVIFFFLGSLQATFIAAVAVPLSIVGTFAAMQLLGYSLNNLTLMALVIASGFVVDDAIVMLENIARYVEQGEKPFPAAFKGAQQIGFTIMSLTVSLIAVLIPLLFMGDVVGRLFREFGVSLAITILISAVVSLTLVPMLAARWLKPHKDAHESRVSRASREAFDRLAAGYDRALGWVLARQMLMLLIFAGTLLLTALLYLGIPKGLFPVQDTGLVQAQLVTDQGIAFGRMQRIANDVGARLARDADVTSVSSFIGVDAGNATLNNGRLLITLKPRNARSGSQDDILTRLRREAQTIPGVALTLQPVQDLTIDSTVGRAQYQLMLQGVSRDELRTWADRLVGRMRAAPTLRNASADIGSDGRALYVDVNRDTASRLGITMQTVDDALYNAFGQRIISTMFTATTQSRVILESAATQPGIAGLANIEVPTGGGGSVPLRTIANIEERDAPGRIDHAGQFPAIGLSFDTAPGASLGQAVADIRSAAASIGLPSNIEMVFVGSAAAFESSLGNTLFLLLAAIVVVYIVLGVLYESFVHPVTILSTLPSAAVGALALLWMTGEGLGITGIIGIVLLIGIVKKNAIMMIDFALVAEREDGKSPLDAIREAAVLRFRPIMMTTLAAIGGALPLMLGTGEGAEIRRGLGIAIVGGLLVSQLITLFTTPVIYLAFDRIARRFERRPRVKAQA
jgi:multidrug efflux pump